MSTKDGSSGGGSSGESSGSYVSGVQYNPDKVKKESPGVKSWMGPEATVGSAPTAPSGSNLTGSFGTGATTSATERSTPAPLGGPGPAQTLNPGSSGGAVSTAVNQKPAENAGGGKPPVDGPEGTVVTAGPRSDFSVVLAGQTGKRPDRSPARSNNFVSLVGGAGGLGRRSAEAKRTLIGGA